MPSFPRRSFHPSFPRRPHPPRRRILSSFPRRRESSAPCALKPLDPRLRGDDEPQARAGIQHGEVPLPSFPRRPHTPRRSFHPSFLRRPHAPRRSFLPSFPRRRESSAYCALRTLDPRLRGDDEPKPGRESSTAKLSRPSLPRRPHAPRRSFLPSFPRRRESSAPWVLRPLDPRLRGDDEPKPRREASTAKCPCHRCCEGRMHHDEVSIRHSRAGRVYHAEVSFRHSRAGGNPVLLVRSSHWIPAFAGMTSQSQGGKPAPRSSLPSLRRRRESSAPCALRPLDPRLRGDDEPKPGRESSTAKCPCHRSCEGRIHHDGVFILHSRAGRVHHADISIRHSRGGGNPVLPLR